MKRGALFRRHGLAAAIPSNEKHGIDVIAEPKVAQSGETADEQSRANE